MDILLVSLVIFLVLGIPIAYSLGLSAFSYFVLFHPELLQILPQRFLSGLNVYALIALPLFILMGLLMNKSGIGQVQNTHVAPSFSILPYLKIPL